MPQQLYGLAVGWNGTPTNIESIAVAGAVALGNILHGYSGDAHYLVKAIGHLDIPYQVTPLSHTQNGFSVLRWMQTIMTVEAYEYLRDTYGQGASNGGLVTVNTRLDTDTYVEKNAVLFVQPPNKFAIRSTSNGSDVFVYEDVEITLHIISDTA